MAYFKGTEKARYVSRMFAEIAPKYDLLNSIMTGGLHHRWRNKVTDLVTEGLEGPSPVSYTHLTLPTILLV